MDDLADEPGVTELLPDARQHLRPEPVRYRVCGVETPAVGSAPEPVRHHVDGVVDDVGVVVVQRDELAVALECLELAAGAAEPRSVVAGDGVSVAREVGPDMVEDTVEQDAQTTAVRLGDEFVEVGVVTEPGVDPVVVGGVITVGSGLEDRPERDTRRAQFDGLIEPFDDAPHPVLVGARRRIGRECADEAERINLPPDRVRDPRRFTHGRNFFS